MAKRLEKPEGTLWPDEVHELYGVAVATLSQWRYYGVGPKPQRVGRKFTVYDAEECRKFFKGWKPRDRTTVKKHDYHKPYELTPERLYMDASTEQIAKDLGMSLRDVVALLKSGYKRFIRHWIWVHCLMRHGLSLDEAVIFVKHKNKKELGKLLNPHVLAIDTKVEGSSTGPDDETENIINLVDFQGRDDISPLLNDFVEAPIRTKTKRIRKGLKG